MTETKMEKREIDCTDLWPWAEQVGRELHPLYLGNGWEWYLPDAPTELWAHQLREVPSANRIAVTVYKLASDIRRGIVGSGVCTGRLTVREDEGVFWVDVETSASVDADETDAR